MDNTSIQQIPTDNTLVSKDTNKKILKKQKIVILVLTVTAIITLIFSIYLLYRNNILNKQVNELMKSPTTGASDNKVGDVSSLTPTPNKLNNTDSQDRNLTHKQVDSCSTDGCLFVKEDTPEGFAKIQGYFFEYEADDWGTLTTCTGLVATGGNETLIAHFNDWIESGNNLNKYIDEKLVVNIYTESLDKSTQNLIISSTINNQVELGVVRITPVGRGASTCSNVIDIVSAKPVPN